MPTRADDKFLIVPTGDGYAHLLLFRLVHSIYDTLLFVSYRPAYGRVCASMGEVTI